MIATLREAKAELSEFVERVAGGEEVLITVRGRPKARVRAVAATAMSFWGIRVPAFESWVRMSA